MIRSSWVAAAVAIVVLCEVGGFPGGAEAQASFDCRRATHPSEVTVCRDSGLASADRHLDATFRSALERSANPDALRAEQRIWLSDLRGCGEDTFCLAETYADRIEALEADRKATEPNPVVKDAATEEWSPDTTSTVGAPLANETGGIVDAASTEARIEPAAGANSDDRSGDAAVVERPDQQRPARTDGIVGMIGGGLFLGLIVALVAALLATKALADHSMRKFGWPMILNWWNVLHLVSFFTAWVTYPMGGIAALAVVSGGLWLIVLTVNVRKTDLLTGLAMTIVQPFVVAIMWVVYGVARAKAEGRRI